MPRIQFFETENAPERIHVGLRMIKTVVAVFLCSLVGWLRGQPAFFSMIAAVVCMQNTTGKTLEISLNQVLGTAIGALFGLGALYLGALGIQEILPLYYLLASLLLIPIIILTLFIKKPSISAFACVVFLSVAVFQLGSANPWIYALQRVLDIIMGVAAAFLINILLPNHTPLEKDWRTEEEQEQCPEK